MSVLHTCRRPGGGDYVSGPSHPPIHRTMTTLPNDARLLRDRVREQEQALADLAIERRLNKETMALMRLQRIDLESSLHRAREAVERRNEQIQNLERLLQQALQAGRSDRSTDARIGRQSSKDRQRSR